MKKVMKYAYVALAGLMAMTFASCAEEYEYDGVGVASPGAYISAEKTTILYAADDAEILTFTLYRTDSIQAGTIGLTCDNDNFQVPASVEFAAGESKKVMNVPFHIMGGTTEEVTIKVTEDSQTQYGVGEMSFIITRDFVWEDLGEGVVSSQLFGESWGQSVLRGEGTNLYKLPDAYYEGYDIYFELSEDGTEIVNWGNGTDEPQPMGYVHSTYGMLYFYPDDGVTIEGNTITIPMLGLVIYNGNFATLYSGFTETIVLPE